MVELKKALFDDAPQSKMKEVRGARALAYTRTLPWPVLRSTQNYDPPPPDNPFPRSSRDSRFTACRRAGKGAATMVAQSGLRGFTHRGMCRWS